MELYRKRLNRRIWLLSLLALFAAGLGVFDVFWATAEMRARDVFEFQCGFTWGLGLLAAILVVRYRRVLRDERELQKQYNWETDERMRLIRAKAGMPMVLISSLVMLVAGIVIGYANSVVFYTLTVAAAGQLIAACVVKFVWLRLL